MSGDKRLALRPLPTLIVTLLTALLLWLGTWQLGRADEKRALLAAFEAAPEPLPWQALAVDAPRYTPVALRGEYDAERQVLLDTMSHEGRPGYHVLTPFRLTDGRLVAVNRGWRAWDGPRDALPPLPAPRGVVYIEGRVSPFFQPGMRLAGGNELEAAAWPRLAVFPEPAEVSRWLGEDIDPRMVLLAPEAPGGFVRAWRPAQIPPSRHVGYAVQWYSLAAALVVLFLIASRRSREES